MSAEEQMPTEEELREQLKQLRIEDVLVQTVVTLVNLTGRKLAVEGEKDLEQGRRGIEAVKALLPLLPEEGTPPIKDALSQLQMVYVRETQQPAAGDQPPGGEEPGAAPRPDAEAEREREKARSKIWTPPGT